MGTGWRRALCTSVSRDDSDGGSAKRRPPPARGDAPATPRKLAFFSGMGGGGGGSNPPAPALRCRTRPTAEPESVAPVTPPQPASAPVSARKRVPLLQAISAPSSPRSPSRFALFKASILPTKARCGVCTRGVKNGGGAAVFTAECSHSFHFPCIAAHARAAASGALCCPVCSAPWRQAPFLASLRLHLDADGSPHRKHRTSDDSRKTAPVTAKAAGVPKVYDDDEPLLAPKSAANGSGFNPIPEANEDGDEGEGEGEEAGREGEFRGFFPHPPRVRTGLAVTVAPEAALVSSGRRHGKYVVVVKVKAPALRSSASRRAPIDLVTVLDVSQGMMGEKLQMLKRGMRLVIASLGPADRLSLVAFSGAAKRLMPLRRMSRQGQRSARQIVDRLVVCAAAQGQEQQAQGACAGDALRKATKVLEDRRDRNPVATVMLLSDTQQQQQQQDARKHGDHHHALRRPQPAPAAAATRFTHVEIPIAGPGPADDAPARSPLAPKQEEQLESSAPAEHAFAKCLGGLVSVVMQEVHLELDFPTGEITAVYSCGAGQQAVALAGGAGGSGGSALSVRLGEMYAEEERELLVELRAPLGAHPHALSVRCAYRDPASQETVRGAEQPLLLPPLHDGGGGGSSTSSSQQRLHDLFVASRAVAESRRLAELGDFSTATHLLSSARRLVLQSPPTQQQQDLLGGLDMELSDMRWRRGQQQPPTPTSRSATPSGTPRASSGGGGGGGSEPLTPTSAWRAAEQLAKVAIMRKSMNRVSDLHGFENARF
ncbi:E3 ubiquitin-protein ligase WAV3-like [Triticum dicoccoides]|uniref:E3 ubiquitin-protein ligase WAV3-like n=1 Tax=Triticum dicoccoides TaxID=85692 RepID=UPI000E7C1262|nr:E3 ubiquitin-protein ligase WAV3-like [Triticum dicoccoides]